MTSFDVRYFAGAAEAAGRDRGTVQADPADSLGGALRGQTERLDRVLDVATLLVDGRRVDPTTPVAEAVGDGGTVVDVLPPFAGG